jgi:hypothetical protein
MTRRLDGPAPTEERLVYDYLTRQRGLPENQIPKELRNVVVNKTKMDNIGQIVVRRMSGLEPNAALAVVKRFEKASGGRDDIAEKLSAVEESLSAEERHFLQLIQSDRSRKGVARLMAEANVRPTKVIERYAAGALALGKMEAAIEVAREQPNIIKDLLRHALDQTEVCQTCVGTGVVKDRAGSSKESTPCPMCEGRRTKLSVSKHKEFAVEKVMEFSGMVQKEKGTTVNVQQNVGIKVNGGGTFMDKVLRTSDEVLYGKHAPAVEAEVVQPEDNPEQ